MLRRSALAVLVLVCVVAGCGGSDTRPKVKVAGVSYELPKRYVDEKVVDLFIGRVPLAIRVHIERIDEGVGILQPRQFLLRLRSGKTVEAVATGIAAVPDPVGPIVQGRPRDVLLAFYVRHREIGRAELRISATDGSGASGSLPITIPKRPDYPPIGG